MANGYKDIAEAKADLESLSSSFWDLVDVLADNLPDIYDDPDTEEYCQECQNRYDTAIAEFKAAYQRLYEVVKAAEETSTSGEKDVIL